MIVAAVHVAMVLSITAKYSWDRDHLPRAWSRTVNFDPNLPVRGRYANLRLVVPLTPQCYDCLRVRLGVKDGMLTGQPGNQGERYFIRGYDAVLANSLAFFLAEHAIDPTVLKPGEELWVEVSVPPQGSPRPLRLGVKRGGELKPLP